jgi:hypothetical protein
VRTVETKGEFARRKHRSPACVSAWIADGKITRAALVGNGMRARIWVEQAEADLAASLNPSQQWHHEFPANAATSPLPISPAVPLVEPPANIPQAAPLPPSALARRIKADADRAEHEAEVSRRKLLVDEGRYIVAEDAAREWARELAKLISEIETFLSTTLAKGLAEKHGLDWKALTTEMREAFRQFRASVSDDARARREAIEATTAEQP